MVAQARYDRMTRVDVAASRVDDVRLAEFCSALGLVVELLPLLTKLGARHWHLRRAGQAGTLELTEWQDAVWISVHSNRRADWVEAAIPLLSSALSDPS